MKYQLISTLDVSDGDRFYEPRKFIHWKKCLKQNVAPRAVYRDKAQAVGGTNVTLPQYSQIVSSTLRTQSDTNDGVFTYRMYLLVK